MKQMLVLLRQAEETIKNADTSLASAQAEMAAADRELESSHEEQEQRMAAQAEAQRILSNQENKIKKLDKSILDVLPAKVAAQEKVTVTEKDIAAIDKTLSSLRNELQQQTQLVQSLKTQRAAVKSAYDAHEAIAKSQAARRPLDLQNNDLAEYNKYRQDVETRVSKDRETLEQLLRQAASKQTEKAKLEQEVTAGEEQLRQYAVEKSSLTERAAKLDEALAQLAADIQEKQAELSTLEKRRRELASKETDLQGKLTEVSSLLVESKVHQREAERSEKFKAAIANMKSLFGAGVYGRLVDLYRPKQDRYATALSVALGGNGDAIVVESTNIAKECLSYLRSQLIGVATFLPLDSLRPKQVSERLRSLDPGAHLAIDLVALEDPRVLRAMEYACGDTLVCESLELARKICFDMQERVKAVTVDGAMIRKSGVMSSGTSNVAKRAKSDADKDALRTRRSALADALDRVQRDILKLPDQAELENAIRGLKARQEATLKSKVCS